MEAIVITLHGRQVCKLVDADKVNKIKNELSKHWNRELIELGKRNQEIQLK